MQLNVYDIRCYPDANLSMYEKRRSLLRISR